MFRKEGQNKKSHPKKVAPAVLTFFRGRKNMKKSTKKLIKEGQNSSPHLFWGCNHSSDLLLRLKEKDAWDIPNHDKMGREV